MTSYYDGMINIYGGSIVADLQAVDSSVITVFGSDFNFPYGDIGTTTGTLAGTLADGTPINASFARATTSRITLACSSVGGLSRSTATLAAGQANRCEDWSDVVQPSDDLSGAWLEFADLTSADLSSSLLTDAKMQFAELSGADLSGAGVSGTELFGATYDESTIFPSGTTYDTPDWDWGLDGGSTPWDAGMIPVPEPAAGLQLFFGALGLAGLAAIKKAA
jgi:hypothetical protein